MFTSPQCIALSPTSHDYVPTRSQSDHHVLLRWLVECRMILVLSPAFKWMSFVSFYRSWYVLSSEDVHHHVLWQFCFESTSLLLCCCDLAACGPTLWAFFFWMEYYLCFFDWLKLLGWLAARSLLDTIIVQSRSKTKRLNRTLFISTKWDRRGIAGKCFWTANAVLCFEPGAFMWNVLFCLIKCSV